MTRNPFPIFPALMTLLWLLPAVPARAADTPAHLDLKIKKEVLMQEMMSGKTMMLPEFEIYDAEGFRIHHGIGASDSFKHDVREALAKHTREERKLSDIHPALVHPDDSPLEDDALKGADFVFVEYWAEWCSPCLQQMEQVADIIRGEPDRNILWLKVEKDPTRLDGMRIQEKRQP
ncbi:hypothetical protein [Thiolapillus sp.]